MQCLDELERSLGYTFQSKALLRTALVNPSYRSEHVEISADQDNQRLEFLGDAVFGLLTAAQLYLQYDKADEGMLTRLRSHLASGRALADLARTISLGKWLLLSSGEIRQNGRNKAKYLTDTMEAIFGAAWLDGGWDAVSKIFQTLNVRVEMEPFSAVERDNPKGELQILAQRNHWPNSPTYELLSKEGPVHASTFRVRAHVSTGQSAEGRGTNKRMAEMDAARKLLAILEQKEE